MAQPPANDPDDVPTVVDIGSPENVALEYYWALRPTQRDAFMLKLIKSDPELVMVADSMLALYRKAKTPRELRPLLRRAPVKRV